MNILLRKIVMGLLVLLLGGCQWPVNSLNTFADIEYSLGRDLSHVLVESFTIKKAYAAEKKELVEEKMLYTIKPTVPFTFTGLAKENAVHHVLKALEETKAHGTFFVTEQEIKTRGPLIRSIINKGHELGIAVRPRDSEDYNKIRSTILNAHDLLLNKFGINTTIVKQFTGAVRPETKKVISDLGYRLIGTTINAVQTRHQNASTSEEVMKDILGSKIYSLGKGWIVNIRMDYYTKETLAADVFRALKRDKIDNIAYYSYNDTPETNSLNNSAYEVGTIGSILGDKASLWQYPIDRKAVLPSMEPKPILEKEDNKSFMSALKKRYIGFKWVNETDRMLGFSTVEAKALDKTGRIHTNDPVIFFSFDDWGTDNSVNKLLYVFRKYGVKGNFFVLTNNVTGNPNLLRSIAMEGHDICAHSNFHKPMATRKNDRGRQYPTQNKEEMLEDGRICYDKLLSITGDIDYLGKPVLTKFYRPPTLAISKDGLKALFDNGYEYIVAGSSSLQDYAAPDLKSMLNRLTDAIYTHGKVKKGAVLVMHMSDNSKYTAMALDMLFTANEKRQEGDPAKFIPGKLSDYLVKGYDQSQPFNYR